MHARQDSIMHYRWCIINYVRYFLLLIAPCRDGDIQLQGVTGHNSFGRVEICINGSWGALCGPEATNRDASVICRQLGFAAQGRVINV